MVSALRNSSACDRNMATHAIICRIAHQQLQMHQVVQANWFRQRRQNGMQRCDLANWLLINSGVDSRERISNQIGHPTNHLLKMPKVASTEIQKQTNVECLKWAVFQPKKTRVYIQQCACLCPKFLLGVQEKEN